MVRKKASVQQSKKYLCYCLRSVTNNRRTYVGITNNFTRRIRQHNGELVGGARYTHAYRPWKPLFRVHGFENKRQVLRFEWAMKHRRRSHKGASPASIRLLTLQYLLSAHQNESTAPMMSTLRSSTKGLRIEVFLSKTDYRKLMPSSKVTLSGVKYFFLKEK